MARHKSRRKSRRKSRSSKNYFCRSCGKKIGKCNCRNKKRKSKSRRKKRKSKSRRKKRKSKSRRKKRKSKSRRKKRKSKSRRKKRKSVFWKGWSKIAPGGHARTVMLKKCGNKCFLGPKNSKKYPICKKGTCTINKKGVMAAFIRGRQMHKPSVWKKAKSILKKRFKYNPDKK